MSLWPKGEGARLRRPKAALAPGDRGSIPRGDIARPHRIAGAYARLKSGRRRFDSACGYSLIRPCGAVAARPHGKGKVEGSIPSRGFSERSSVWLRAPRSGRGGRRFKSCRSDFLERWQSGRLRSFGRREIANKAVRGFKSLPLLASERSSVERERRVWGAEAAGASPAVPTFGCGEVAEPVDCARLESGKLR